VNATTDRQPGLAVAICTMNNERTIGRVLESVCSTAAAIVVVDSGSTDQTLAICRRFGAVIIEQPWLGHVKQKQLAVDHCSDYVWTLLLDSDESLEPELQESIRQVVQKDDPAFVGWELNRKVWFLGGYLHHTYDSEWRLRLFRSGQGHLAGKDPHDRIDVHGPVGRLPGILRHDSWLDMADLVERQLQYASLRAQDPSLRTNVLKVLINPWAAMFKKLVIKRGLLDGWRGLIAAGMTANFVMLKHLMVAARQLEDKPRDPSSAQADKTHR